MDNPFGYPARQWARAKREAREILVGIAREQEIIAYSDVATEIHAIELEAYDRRLDALLGEISEEEDAAGRGMLSAVVVHKDGDQRPGDGFFNWAEELGYIVADRDRFWIGMLIERPRVLAL